MVPQDQEEQAGPATEEASAPRECHNCGRPVTDRYCAHCGQEYSDRVLSMQRLAGEFVEQSFSYDSNLARTLRCLLRPGFLTTEYFAGRRASYIAPFRLYILASVVLFFTLSLNLWNSGRGPGAAGPEPGPGGEVRIEAGPSEVGHRWEKLLDSDQPLREYDRQQAALPPGERDGTVQRFFARRVLATLSLRKQMGDQAFQQEIVQRMVDNAPTGMFLILPLFALLLKVAYFRSKRLYIEHLVYALHVHAFMFLAIAVMEVLPARPGIVDWLAVFLMGWYALAAARCVYGQSLGKTILKFALLLPAYVFLLVLAASVVALLSLVQG